MKNLSYLFEPIKLGESTIPNRIVMPPMRTGFGLEDGSVSERLEDYYVARAAGGTGLIIIEATTVNKQRKYTANTLGLYDDKFIPGWTSLISKIQEKGAKVALQLLDPGPVSPSKISCIQPEGPSPVAARNIKELPKELSTKEVEGVVSDFIEAALRARKAGIDAVQIHAAHAFAMVGSFLSPRLNKRTDKYGGSLIGRMNLLKEILEGIRDATEGKLPIIVRISGDDRLYGERTVQETEFIAPMIEEAGASALEVSGGTVPEAFWGVVPPIGTPLALNAELSKRIKEVVNIPVISVGRINDPVLGDFLIHWGKADMVSMGRALIADPNLPDKARQGKFDDIVPCLGDNQGCLGVPLKAKETTCIVNPCVGFEAMAEIKPSADKKRVIIIGGGPAGLKAAQIAALRGHEVELFEKEERLGGQLNIASVAPGKQELIKIIQYLSRQCAKLGVKINLNSVQGASQILDLNPDEIIVATGASPITKPEWIAGFENEQVVSAWDVLKGKAGLNARNAVVIGGGSVACETADYLAETGDNLACGSTNVTLIEMNNLIALDMSIQARHLLMQRLREKGIKIMTSVRVEEILPEGIAFSKNGVRDQINGIDCVILAVGAEPVNNMATELKKDARTDGKGIHLIGDAKEPRSILEATAEGEQVARAI